MSRSTQTFGQTPQLHTRSMNYGVELEFVFGFRQDELDLGHTNGVPNTLKKNMRYFERESQVYENQSYGFARPPLQQLGDIVGLRSRQDATSMYQPLYCICCILPNYCYGLWPHIIST